MFKRSDRLKELFFREVNLALQDINGIKDHGLVTLTGVDLTKDGKMLYVYFSVLGSEYDRTRSESLLTSSIYLIRQAMKKRLRLKNIPAIMFKYDPTPENAAKIEDIFSKINSEKKNENPGS